LRSASSTAVAPSAARENSGARGDQPLGENGYKVERLRGTVEEALLTLA
jgi:hypothetical protein